MDLAKALATLAALNSYAKALVGAAVSAALAFGASVSAHDSLPMTVVTTLSTFLASIVLVWGAKWPLLKHIGNGFTAAAATFLVLFVANTSTLQLVIQTAVSFVVGAGWVAITPNDPPALPPSDESAAVRAKARTHAVA